MGSYYLTAVAIVVAIPIVALAVADDACHRMGVASLQLVVLLVVTTATVVRLGGLRR